ncbi:MAG TPA: hypothetical protein VJ729_05495 [Nitrososphaeraceae archaeon]|nr:hypothetical protein [Nitrososphaeraceae archaeon]
MVVDTRELSQEVRGLLTFGGLPGFMDRCRNDKGIGRKTKKG